MNEIQTLKANAEHYQLRANQCVDIIKQLQGYTPDKFTFTFSIGAQTITTFDIGPMEGNFCVGIFMSWHSYYLRLMNEQLAVLSALEAQAGNCNWPL